MWACDRLEPHGELSWSSRAVLSLVMAKLVTLDLDAAVFREGDAAATVAAHIAVTLWRPDASDTIMLCIARSFAPDFWHALVEASLEYGVDVVE